MLMTLVAIPAIYRLAAGKGETGHDDADPAPRARLDWESERVPAHG